MEKVDSKKGLNVIDCFKRKDGNVLYLVQDGDGIAFELTREDIIKQQQSLIPFLDFYEKKMMLEDMPKSVQDKILTELRKA